jgi:CheY-like chemotaxis protein
MPARPRVLVVDDNHDFVTAAKHALELAGYEVEVATDGLTALSIAATFRPHVAMIDIALPLIDGWEVARRLRRIELLRGTALIAISGHAEPEHRDESLAAGFSEHLAKPVDLAHLTRAIAAACVA